MEVPRIDAKLGLGLTYVKSADVQPASSFPGDKWSDSEPDYGWLMAMIDWALLVDCSSMCPSLLTLENALLFTVMVFLCS